MFAFEFGNAGARDTLRPKLSCLNRLVFTNQAIYLFALFHAQIHAKLETRFQQHSMIFTGRQPVATKNFASLSSP